MNRRTILAAVAISLSSLLVACGGGGDDTNDQNRIADLFSAQKALLVKYSQERQGLDPIDIGDWNDNVTELNKLGGNQSYVCGAGAVWDSEHYATCYQYWHVMVSPWNDGVY